MRAWRSGNTPYVAYETGNVGESERLLPVSPVSGLFSFARHCSL